MFPTNAGYGNSQKGGKGNHIYATAGSGAKERFAGQSTLVNARMPDLQRKAHCPLAKDSRQLIKMAREKLGLSVRSSTRSKK